MKKMPEKIKAENYDLGKLKEDILCEARVLRVRAGFAEIIADKVCVVVEKFLKKHSFVTKEEVEKIVHRELEKYNKDLAYIYHNRDKII